MTTNAFRWLALSVGVGLLGCGSGEPDKPEGETAVVRPRIGAVMIENGRRFEICGRAAANGRWELAAYEVQEILELFNDDMTRALLPGDCNDEVADRAYFALLEDVLPALRARAEARDTAGFATAYGQAAGQCNTCHATCQAAFIDVPSTPGESVPRMEPPPAPAPAPAPAPEPSPSPSPPAPAPTPP